MTSPPLQHCKIIGLGLRHTLDDLVFIIDREAADGWIPLGAPWEHKYRHDCGPEWCITVWRPPSAPPFAPTEK